MSGAYACPECGARVQPKGRAPGRQFVCRQCGTLVEIPFLPRAVGRRRFRPSSVPLVVWVAAGLVAVLSVGVVASKQFLRARARATQRTEMSRLEARIDETVSADRWDQALEALEAALGRHDLPWRPDEFEAMQSRRDAISRRLAESTVANLRLGPPATTIKDGLILLARVERDPVLASFRTPTRALVTQAVARELGQDLEQAARELDQGRGVPALQACERVRAQVRALPDWAAPSFDEQSRALARQIAGRYGATLAPIGGTYWLGSSDAYEKALRPALLDALRQRGYATSPEDPTLRPLWDELAPYRLSVAVVERPGGPYLQSAHQITTIEAEMVWRHPRAADWRQAVHVKTEVPLPNLTAYEGSRLAMASTPSAEVQQRLHANAFAALVARVVWMVRLVPELPMATPGSASWQRVGPDDQRRPSWSSTTLLRLSPSPF